MIESKTLASSAVCPPAMAALVYSQGWTLVRSEGILGYHTAAVIEKDGVVIRYTNSKGEQDYGVALTPRVHPALSRELDREPDLLEVLSAIGVEANFSNVVLKADQNLSSIKGYLADTTVWEQRVRSAATVLLAQYASWNKGPEVTRDLAKSLAARNPWLITGKLPNLSDLGSFGLSSADESRRLPLGFLIAVVGISVIAAHYLT